MRVIQLEMAFRYPYAVCFRCHSATNPLLFRMLLKRISLATVPRLTLSLLNVTMTKWRHRLLNIKLPFKYATQGNESG